jgi:hypothetical protein
MERKENTENILQKAITGALILFIVVVVYFSGPSTAFYITNDPSMQHKPGTRDVNITVTFYKERYEAIGTIEAKLQRLPPNPSSTELNLITNNPALLLGQGATDVNCWATAYANPTTGQNNTSFYSYELNAYYAPGASGPFASGTNMDYNFDIFAYGYMWDPWNITNTNPGTGGATRGPTDKNFVYRFVDWSNDMGFSYTPGAGNQTANINQGAAQFGYYGYGYNYAGKFTCTFKFSGIPEGLYVGVVPFINGLAVDETGYNAAQAGQSAASNTTGSVFAIKDVNTQTSGCGTGNANCTTDLNLFDPSGVKRFSFHVPRTSTDANTQITFITVDINADSVATPDNVDIKIGQGSNGPPRFTLAAGGATGVLPNFTLTDAGTLTLTYSGFVSAAQEAEMISKLKIYSLKNGSWTKSNPTFSDASGSADRNEMTITITQFV